MRSISLKTVAIVTALLAPAIAIAAGNNVFFTNKGDLTFPFVPPSNSGATPGTIDNMTIGATTPRPGTFSQIIPAAGVPTIASGACGAAANGAVVAGSTNQAGSITIGAATTTTCTITFAAGLTAAPKACVFFPMNAAAAATGTTVARIGAPTTANVVLSGSALASANYAYICM
jgi:hypothetical protein